MFKRSLLWSALFSAGLLFGAALHAAEGDDKVLATVNGESLTEADYQDFIETVERQSGKKIPKEQRQAAVDELISRELVVQDAKQQKLDEHPRFQERMEEFRYNLLAEFGMTHYLEQHPTNDEELKAEYEKRIAETELPTEYKARHILVKEEDAAKAIIEEIKGGADFAELAKEKSEGPSGKKGGDLGWFVKEKMVPAFGEAVAAMEKGELSETPVKTQFGWHVILLEDTRQSEPPAFEMIKERLAQAMKNQRILDYIAGLRKKAQIEVKDDAMGEQAAEQTDAPVIEE